MIVATPSGPPIHRCNVKLNGNRYNSVSVEIQDHPCFLRKVEWNCLPGRLSIAAEWDSIKGSSEEKMAEENKGHEETFPTRPRGLFRESLRGFLAATEKQCRPAGNPMVPIYGTTEHDPAGCSKVCPARSQQAKRGSVLCSVRGASERSENAAGGICQHSARIPHDSLTRFYRCDCMVAGIYLQVTLSSMV